MTDSSIACSLEQRPQPAPSIGGRLCRRILTVALAAGCAASPVPGAGKCADTYHVSGRVIDATDRPVSDVRVYLLLDKVSEREFAKQGVRAVITRTDKSGWYAESIVCGGRPDPCARNPAHFSMLTQSKGSSLRLKTFKLKSLNVVKRSDGCVVRVPDMRLASAW